MCGDAWYSVGTARGLGPAAVRVGVDRTVAMLSLTAIHDIMKVEALRPAGEGSVRAARRDAR